MSNFFDVCSLCIQIEPICDFLDLIMFIISLHFCSISELFLPMFYIKVGITTRIPCSVVTIVTRIPPIGGARWNAMFLFNRQQAMFMHIITNSWINCGPEAWFFGTYSARILIQFAANVMYKVGKFGDSGLNRFREICLPHRRFDCIFYFCVNFRLDVASDVIYGVAAKTAILDVHIKLGDAMNSWVMLPAHFTMDINERCSTESRA